jgi:hypothetical protein
MTVLCDTFLHCSSGYRSAEIVVLGSNASFASCQPSFGDFNKTFEGELVKASGDGLACPTEAESDDPVKELIYSIPIILFLRKAVIAPTWRKSEGVNNSAQLGSFLTQIRLVHNALRCVMKGSFRSLY